jgi:hypothetical protein
MIVLLVGILNVTVSGQAELDPRSKRGSVHVLQKK